jgi:hypothetical protein
VQLPNTKPPQTFGDSAELSEVDAPGRAQRREAVDVPDWPGYTMTVNDDTEDDAPKQSS